MDQTTKTREEVFNQLVARGLSPIRLPSVNYRRSGQASVHWGDLNAPFNDWPETWAGKITWGVFLLGSSLLFFYAWFRSYEFFEWSVWRVMGTALTALIGVPALVFGAWSLCRGVYQGRVIGNALQFARDAGDKRAFRAYMWLFPHACGNCGFRERIYASWSVDRSSYEDPYASEFHAYSRCTRCGKPYSGSFDYASHYWRSLQVVRASSPYLTKEESDAVPDFPYLKDTTPSATSRWRLWKKRVRNGAEVEGGRPTSEWLEELLRHDDWFVRLAAARGLAATDNGRAAQLLIDLVRGDESCLVREAAAEELAALNWEPASPFEVVWRLIALRKGPFSLADSLPTSGREDWLGPLADALMSADPQGRIMAAHAFGRCGMRNHRKPY